ncbi:sialic acid TRAP transporter permease protein SiaT [Roseovarius sp. A-2]|uniref:TRAP transporter small permease n=1 Tax=Roseovarius sp. A-2 TaxID=1570360 RepID=UPI0009B51761|nr:TRAP transporter small permease [Roseovarius sp. A-2]GAW34409.1 sialic acid TRAP transporter permease protein SiaT [Roseovarius sp. A-2]
MTRLLKSLEVGIGSFCLFAMFSLLCINIVMRYAFNSAVPWVEEVSNYLFVWAGFLSCAHLLGEEKHLRVDFAVNLLPLKAQAGAKLFNDMVLVVFFVSMVIPSIRLLGKLRTTPSLRMPEAIPYSILPITMVICLVHLASLIRRHYAAYREASA